VPLQYVVFTENSLAMGLLGPVLQTRIPVFVDCRSNLFTAAEAAAAAATTT